MEISVDDPEIDLARPSLSFSGITFSDGQTIRIEPGEVVVFVGPNNAGKSAALRELHQWVGRSIAQKVIVGASLHRIGDEKSLRAYLERYAQKRGDVGQVHYTGLGYDIFHNNLSWFDRPDDRHPVASFFSSLIGTETRLTGSNPAPPISLYDEPPTHPIHLLLQDDKLAELISTLFRRAFGKDLVVFRGGGSQFPLYVGNKPAKSVGKDELSKEFVDALRASSEPLQGQGDGMRSFATVLLYVLAVNNHSIQFLDEPEAFLHPPQARLLGEYIASQRQSKSQLFIATHSTDILEGLITGGSNKIRVVRIQRDGNTNRAKELSKEKTASISSDPLTRYSGVFSGIFYERVIIAEADGDCLLYNSLLRTKTVSGDHHPDVLFIHAAGKHRMGDLAETLRALGVHVSVIADLDLLNDEGTFRGLVEKLGGSWTEMAPHWKAIKTSVESLRPPLTVEQVKQLIQKELDAVSGSGSFPKASERNIKYVFKTLSPWDVIKQAGRRGFKAGPTTNQFDQLAAKCSEIGLWLVPEGEIEGFCRSIEAGHGPAFVERVLQERNIETDVELEEARTFIKRVWQGP
jgi:energy-coupling factor transporter ATP-binding protein EcfA2